MKWAEVYGCDFGQDEGSILFMSTPKGNNYFHKLFMHEKAKNIINEFKTYKYKPEGENKMNGYYPQEGCAPDPNFVDPLTEVTRRDPIVGLAIQQASQLGYAQAENHHISGEARTYRRKLDEAEQREASLANKLDYTRNDLKDYIDENIDLSEKVEKLEKKLAPKKKKVAKKAKKVSKK